MSKCGCGHGPDMHPKRMTGRVTRREKCFNEGCHCARYDPLPPHTAARQCLRCSNFALEGYQHCRQCMKELAAAGKGPTTHYPCAWCGTWEASKGDDLCPPCQEADEDESMQDYPKPEPITIKSYDTTETTSPVCTNPDCRPWVHPAYLCPKRITADKENTLGKNKKDDWDKLSEWDRMRREIADLGERLTQRENAHRNLHASLEATDREVYGLRDFVHRANTEANKRLDDLEDKVTILDSSRICEVQRLNNIVLRVEQLEKTVADLTGRMGAREDAAHNLVEALDDVNKNLDTTDECVTILRETVEKLAGNQEKLLHMIELTKDTDLTQNRLLARHHDRLVRLEDRLDPPSPDESLDYRIVQQDDEPHGLDADGHCADCDGLATESVLSNQERIDLIGRWMHPGLWSAMDGRREAILKILGGQHVEPPLAGGGGCR